MHTIWPKVNIMHDYVFIVFVYNHLKNYLLKIVLEVYIMVKVEERLSS